MRPAYFSVLGSLAIVAALLALPGCENSGTPEGNLDFDASFPRFDASRAPDSGPAPDTFLTANPSLLSNEANARFEFTSNQAGARFGCRIDEGTPAECTSPHTVPVTEGAHTFEVAAISEAGLDVTPATFVWMVDLTPPATTISKKPAALDNSKAVTFEFATGETSTFKCKLDAQAPVDCVSPYELTGLTDGAHTLTITATDEAGNAATPVSHTWTVDTTLPDAVIQSGPTGFVNVTTAAFTFSSPNAGAGPTFACSLDGAAFATCVSPRNLTGLANGPHTFRVRVTSAAGNQDPTPAERTWTVDTVPPTVAITGGPTGPTNDATPTFTFDSAGATATACRVDAAAFAPCTSPHTTAALSDAAHTFQVRATDAAGNTATASRAFTVDTAAPAVTITGGPNGPTNDTTPAFSFTAAAGATTACRVDGAAFAACTSPFTSAALANGARTFEVRATDAAGNASTATRAFTVDTVAPTVTITGGPNGPTNDATPTFTFTTVDATTTRCRIDSGAYVACASPFTAATLADGNHTFEVRAGDAATNEASATRAFSVDTALPSIVINSGPSGFTNDATPTWTFTAGAGAVSTSCAVDGAAFAPCTSPFTTGVLSDAAHGFQVRAFDPAGNFATATRSITVDTVAPGVTITGGPAGPTNDATPTFTFTVTNASTVNCRINTGPYVACTSPYTPAALAEGAHTFEVRGIDLAANSASATRAFTVDTTLPTIVINAGPGAFTNDATPTFTFTSGAGAVSTSCSVDGGAFTGCTSPFTTAALTDAAHGFVVRAFDAAGNFASASRSFTVDTAPPTVTITGGPNGPSNDSTPAFTFTSVGASTTTCRVDAAAFAPCTSPFTSAALAEGAHTFEVRVVDAATNSASATRAFSVDVTLPSIVINSGPAGPTNDNTATFTFTAGSGATRTQCRIDAAAFAACTSPFTSAALSDAAHTFTVRAFDAAGNFADASRSFTVDTAPPVVNITSGPTGLTNNAFPRFDFTAAGHTTLECRFDLAAFAPCTSPLSVGRPGLADGAHTFYVRATDAATNSATATRSFTLDATAPVITLNGASGNVLGASGSFTFTVTGAPTAVECSFDGSAFAACTSPFNYLRVARNVAHTFIVRATDSALNTGTAQRTFTPVAGPTIDSGPTYTPMAEETFTFTPGSAAVTTQCRIYNTSTGAIYQDYVNCSSPRLQSMPPPGDWYFEVRVTDSTGAFGYDYWAFTTYIIF